MSDFLLQLARRSAGLAPAVRVRPAQVPVATIALPAPGAVDSLLPGHSSPHVAPVPAAANAATFRFTEPERPAKLDAQARTTALAPPAEPGATRLIHAHSPSDSGPSPARQGPMATAYAAPVSAAKLATNETPLRMEPALPSAVSVNMHVTKTSLATGGEPDAMPTAIMPRTDPSQDVSGTMWRRHPETPEVWPNPVTPSPATSTRESGQTQGHSPTPEPPPLRPLPAGAPLEKAVEPARAALPGPATVEPLPERVVEVRIGTIEIHGATPAAPAPAAPVIPATPARENPSHSDGFNHFSRLRSYAPWAW